MTTTIETTFGSRIFVRGFLLNNQLTDFDFAPGGANAVAPGKRPRSSMAPSIVFEKGKPVLAVGSPGGSMIINYVAKALVGILDWRLDIQAAFELPNFGSRNGPTLIEFFTYRAEGHSTSDDPTGYRAKGEAEEWPLGDPIARLKAHLVALGEWDDTRDAALDEEINATVRAAQKEAEKTGTLSDQGFDNIPSMFEDVYAETPWHLAEQRDASLEEAREYLGRDPE